MKRIYLLSLLCAVFALVNAQNFKPALTPGNTGPVNTTITLPPGYKGSTAAPLNGSFTPKGIYLLNSKEKFNSDLKIEATDLGLPVMITGTLKQVQGDLQNQAYQYLEALKSLMHIADPRNEFAVDRIQENETGHTLIKMKQVYKGMDVYNGEIILHVDNGLINMMNGRYFRTPVKVNTQAVLQENEAIMVVRNDLGSYKPFVAAGPLAALVNATGKVQQEVFHSDFSATPALCWHVTYQPDILHTWEYFIDAQNGSILRKYDRACFFAAPPLPAGSGTDLNGVTQTLNTYQQGGTFYLVDDTRAMFNNTASQMPNQPVGVIWVLDWNNQPQSANGNNITQITSGSSTFNNQKAVSAYYNAATSYNYFLTTFNRNSIDGSGGNVVSFINVADENGNSMDNAFWNGQYMFYGNGAQTFNGPLQKSLDVGGHEMTHGVVQNTANLEYQGQSGAMNESFADIFGCMIDRDDWMLGEGLVNTAAISTGVLRNMGDPHNGQTTGANGWQPENTGEMYTGQQDNGGVHINSGIANRAFYLFTNDAAVGKNNAEKVYYHALSTYLVKSSQFSDLRVAVLRSVQDLFAGNTAMLNAACGAFDAVGISGQCNGTTTPDNHQDDLDTNPGSEFIVYVNTADNNHLYIANVDGSSPNLLSNTSVISKPSVTDNGAIILFVGNDNHIHILELNWSTSQVTENILSQTATWRNVAVSKDGNRLAALSSSVDNNIYVYNFTGASVVQQAFTLYNPTNTQGIEAGGVEYADAMEWDYSNEWVMYDASNDLSSNGVTVSYWDIGFLHAWNLSAGSFANGEIQKLFSSLPENTDIGNPVFAKNSPYIISFDIGVNNAGGTDYYTNGANIEDGSVGDIIFNNQVGYPCYSRNDNKLIFNTSDNNSNPIIGVISLTGDKITGSGNVTGLIPSAVLGVWIANGNRNYQTFVPDLSWSDDLLSIYPNPTTGEVFIHVKDAGNVVQVSVTDIQGKEVYRPANMDWSITNRLDLSFLQAGVYLINVKTPDKSHSAKMVKLN